VILIEYYLERDTILNRRYRINEPLGKGGFGITYLCTDLPGGERVAVKEFFPRGAERNGNNVSPVSDDLKEVYYDKLSSFSEEFRIISTISNDHVVKVLDFFTENNTAYYVMEFIDGLNLKEYIKNNGIPDLKTCYRILLDILDGVNAIHDRGYIHGDLKPTNIMATGDGRIKVMDFGAACLKDAFFSFLSAKVISISYTCPEKFFASSVPDNSWDIYSIGGIMFFLLSGKDPVPATERIKGIPLEMSLISNRKARLIVEKAMSFSPQKRYRDSDHFKKALSSRFFF
jgi:serine/threonine-protein kinase